MALRTLLQSTEGYAVAGHEPTGSRLALTKLWRRIMNVTPNGSVRNVLLLPVRLIRRLYLPLCRCLVNLRRRCLLAVLRRLLPLALSRLSRGTRRCSGRFSKPSTSPPKR
jgi:hypothetical protein